MAESFFGDISRQVTATSLGYEYSWVWKTSKSIPTIRLMEKTFKRINVTIEGSRSDISEFFFVKKDDSVYLGYKIDDKLFWCPNNVIDVTSLVNSEKDDAHKTKSENENNQMQKRLLVVELWNCFHQSPLFTWWTTLKPKVTRDLWIHFMMENNELTVHNNELVWSTKATKLYEGPAFKSEGCVNVGTTLKHVAFYETISKWKLHHTPDDKGTNHTKKAKYDS